MSFSREGEKRYGKASELFAVFLCPGYAVIPMYCLCPSRAERELHVRSVERCILHGLQLDTRRAAECIKHACGGLCCAEDGEMTRNENHTRDYEFFVRARLNLF